METLPVVVVGLGNQLLGDDGIGLAVARALAARHPHDVEVREAAAGGLRLLELLEGCSRAILVDAAESDAPPGTIREVPIGAAVPALPGAGGHGIRLDEAIALGRALGVTLPEQIVCLSIAVADTRTFHDGLTGPLAAALPAIVRRVEEVLAQWRAEEALSTKPA